MDIPALKQQPQINTFANLMRGVTGAINNVREPVQNTLFNLLSGAYADRLLNKMGMEQPTINQLRQEMNSPEVQMAMNIMPIGMIAYHGSPHTFDKFSMDKIGTGEGAQAYGHGLYFAEAPGVAQKYASDLGVIGAIDSGGRQLSKGDISMIFAERLEKSGVPSGAARSQGDLWAESFVKGQIPKHSIAQNAIKDLGLRQSIDSSLYKVDIPEEAVARFLDWDKPLSQQAPEAMNSLKAAYKKKTGVSDRYMESEFLPNRSLNDAIGGGRMDQSLTQALLESGVPGIKYLDGGSRKGGVGSSNFVVFDPEMIRILERNGQATGAVPWQPGEWRGLLGNN